MKKKQSPIFFDPTKRRLFILAAVALALFLIWLYCRLFESISLFNFSAYGVRPFRLRFVRILNRAMLTLLGLHYLKILLYMLCARRPRPPRGGAAAAEGLRGGTHL